MKIKRIVDGKEVDIELTKEELQEATREHFALQNEEFIRDPVYNEEEYDDMSDEEKEEMIHEIAWQMVDHITIEGDDFSLFLELAEEYRKENGFGVEDFDEDNKEETLRKHVDIYTDGACRSNPGPGGWGSIIVFNDTETEISGGERNTTNNRMELTAVISALSLLKEPCNVTITTDSKYVADAIEKRWLDNWKKRGWKKSDGSPVLNPDLWQQLDKLLQKHNVQFNWVKGHAGHPYNERCDKLAVRETNKF